jgi:hypothetical protein
VKEVTDTSGDRVIFALGLGRRLGLLSTSFVIVVAADRHPAQVIVDERCHWANASLLDAVQIGLHARRKHASADRLSSSCIRAWWITHNFSQTRRFNFSLKQLRRSSREGGEADRRRVTLKSFVQAECLKRRRLLLLQLSALMFFQNVA